MIHSSESEERTDSANHAVTGIKAIAVIMVVGIHAAVTQDQSMGTGWWLSLLQNTISRPCIPWFFMVSGFLLLDSSKTRPLLAFYHRRLTRLLVPFLFWAMVYLGWRTYEHHETFSLKEIVVLFLEGSVYYHLWFLYVLAALYLAAPFLERLRESLLVSERIAFVLLWFAFASILPWLEWFGGFELGVPEGWFGSYFGYFFLGGCLRDFRLRAPQRTPTTLLLVFIWIMTFGASAWISWRDSGVINEVFLASLAPNIVILSFFGFLLLRELDWERILFRTGPLGLFLRFLSGASLGIYLAHVLVLELVQKFFPLPDPGSPFRPLLVALLTLVFTGAIVRTGVSLPFLRRVFN